MPVTVITWVGSITVERYLSDIIMFKTTVDAAFFIDYRWAASFLACVDFTSHLPRVTKSDYRVVEFVTTFDWAGDVVDDDFTWGFASVLFDFAVWVWPDGSNFDDVIISVATVDLTAFGFARRDVVTTVVES